MLYDFSDTSAGQRYFLMTQSIMPRPIAWILTENPDGSHNLAPFSFFTPVCSNPPTLVVSVGNKEAGIPKDTWANIQRTGHAVVHVPSLRHIDSVNSSAATLDAGVSEVVEAGLTTVPLQTVAGDEYPLPRIDGVDVAYGCRYQQHVDLGAAPQHIVFLEVEHLYVADEVLVEVKDRKQIGADELNPLSRLGGADYAVIGDKHSRARPD